MLLRQGLRLGKLLKVAVFLALMLLVLVMLNTGGQFSCGVFFRVNETHVNVDGRNFILDSAVDVIRSRQVILQEVPIRREDLRTKADIDLIDQDEIELERPKPHSTIPSHLPSNQNSSQNEVRHPQIIRTLISERNTTEHKYPWGSIEKECDSIPYDLGTLSKVSVIITFHDSEILANLIETIHCLLQRTPPSLLQEIILVSDNVQKEDLLGVLDQYIVGLQTDIIRMLRSHQQLGLIKARLMGIRAARAPVVVCMDSHMELQEGWLQPLLYEIHVDRKTLAAPYLDWMEFDAQANMWKITHGASSWKTYFDWNFVFGFQEISQKDRIEQANHPTVPVKCPVTIGTVFAIDKQWFTDIGEFDEQMLAWGGENLDLPIRVWLNGGRVINVPCSHAAHYEAPNSRSYRQGWDPMIHYNYKRVAEVWLDDYKKYLYYYRPELTTIDVGNLTSRFALKKRAKYNFKWILDNVFPELGRHDVNTFAHTGVTNIENGKCLMSIGLYNPTLSECYHQNPSKQGFYFTMEGQLRFPVHIYNTAMGNTRQYVLKTEEYISRYGSHSNTVWFHWRGGPMIDARNNLCLEGRGFNIFLAKCDYELAAQQWEFNTYTQEYEDFVQASVANFSTHYLAQLYAVIKAALKKDWVLVDSLVRGFTDIAVSNQIPASTGSVQTFNKRSNR